MRVLRLTRSGVAKVLVEFQFEAVLGKTDVRNFRGAARNVVLSMRAPALHSAGRLGNSPDSYVVMLESVLDSWCLVNR
jgi:hypothetical protein